MQYMNGHLLIFRWIYFYSFDSLRVWVWDTKLVYWLHNSSGCSTANSFQKTIVCKTSFSDCHMLIATTLRSTFIKLPPKTVKYRSYKNFSETVFLHELDQKLIQGDLYCCDDPYMSLTEIFSYILDNYAPVKSLKIRKLSSFYE